MEDTQLDILEPGLWGAHVTEGNPVPLESGERRLTVSRATLEKGDRAQLFLSIKGTKYALGTLSKDKKAYTKLDIDIFEGTEEKYEFSVVGDGTVALIGSHSPPLFDEGDDDEFGSLSDLDDSEEDDGEDEAAYAAALKVAVKPKSAGKAQLPPANQAAKPAAQQKGQQNQQKGQQNQQKGQQNQQKGKQNQEKGQPNQPKGQPKGQQQKGKQEAAKPVETKPAEETPAAETKPATAETTSVPESPKTPVESVEMAEVNSDSSAPATPTSPKQNKGGKVSPNQKKGQTQQQKKTPAKPGNTPKAVNPKSPVAGNTPKSPAAGGNQAKRPNTPNTQGNAQKKQKK